jgi:DNA topoisomerase-1
MSYSLVIVESPNKINKVKEYCGIGYEVVATYGNIYTMKDLNLIISNKFLPKYELLKDGSKTKNNKKLKEMCKKASRVILATDNDREGEHIAYQVCNLCNLSVDGTPRIRFNEISRDAIQNALENIDNINKPLVHAAQTRQIIDLILGYTISPILWKHIDNNSGGTLSAGRCQTPTLRLLYDRHMETSSNKSELYEYKLMGYFTKYHIPFQCIDNLPDNWLGGWLADTSKSQEECFEYKSDNYFLDCCKTSNYQIEIDEPKIVYENPPLPLNTSKIQQLSPFPAKTTMTHLSQLYELGYITYIRTETKKYSLSFIEQITQYITKELGESYVGDMIDLATTSSGSHEAIRPTNIYITPAHLIKIVSKKEVNQLYSIIYRHTFESCSSKCKSFQLRCNIQTIVNEIPYTFQHTSSMYDFYGWKIHTNPATSTSSTKIVNNEYNYLNSLRYEKSNNVKCHKLKIYPKPINTSNRYYTEAKIIDKLETLGIGRPSTYASLTDKLFERKYVSLVNDKGVTLDIPFYELNYSDKIEDITIRETIDTFSFCEEKNKVNIEELGIRVIEFLLSHFEELFDYDYTKNMEKMLDDMIEKDGTTLATVQKISTDFYNNVIGYVSKIKVSNSISNSISLHTSLPVDKRIRSLSEGDVEHTNLHSRCLGLSSSNVYMYIKKGKYGTYAEWVSETGETNRISISKSVGNRPLENITLVEVEKIVMNKTSDGASNKSESNIEKGFIRVVTKNISIHKGKYGYYIYFKTPVMKKAMLYNLSEFTEDVVSCSISTLKKWIQEKYKIY